MAVNLPDLLDPEQVALELTALTMEEALSQLVGLLHRNRQIEDKESFLAAVIKRERARSTVAGHGIAFPHARTDLVKNIVLGIGRSNPGVSFDDSGNLVHLIFLIGVPQQMVQDYLVCIGTLARVVNDDAVRSKLLSARTPAEFVEHLRHASVI